MIGRTTFIYGVVSGSCLLLHNAVLILADRAGAPLLAGVTLSFILVAAVGYVAHSLLTFGERLSVMRFGRYALAMSANMPLAYVSTWIWHVPLGLPMLWAAPLASISMVAINFGLSRWAIVSPKRATGQG